MKKVLFVLLLLNLLLPHLRAQASGNTTGLQLSYSSAGIQTLSYNGTVLEDLSVNASDAFHIWHMKMTDLQGNLLSGPQYNWGEVNNGRYWNTATSTWTYNFTWGQINVQFVQNGNWLNMNVHAVNFSGSGVIFDGATIYPLVLHFPALPAGFGDSANDQLAFNTTGPSVTAADWGQGEVVAVDPDAKLPLYSGFQPSGTPYSYTPIISGATPDGVPTFYPRNDRPVMPGQTDNYTVSLRFAASGTADSQLAKDAFLSWAKNYPPVLNWKDRRIIGTVYLASSPSGNPSYPAGYPNNPRRYFNDGKAADFDVTTAAGLVLFQNRILQQAASNVQNLRQLNAQGAITWDIEGEQYPQTTSYVCQPDEVAQAAPEMESVIINTASPYHGMKLDDAYFKIMTDAGFRAGVCVRPQHFTINPDGTASQLQLPDNQVAAELIRKMRYAHNRWGTTLFYVDSTVDVNGAPLSASIFQQVAGAFPDSLIMPEETTPLYYAYTAAFLSFIFHQDLGTPLDVYSYYPNAFSVNLVNDVNAAVLAQDTPQLTESVRRGDILMVHADYWDTNNATVLQIYQAAGTPAPTPTPVPAPIPGPTVPVLITSPSTAQTLSGTIMVDGQISFPLDAAGSYLMVDGTEIGTQRVTGTPFVYSLDTTALSNGTHNLQIWAHDINNDTLISAAVAVMISNSGTTPPPVVPIPPVPLPPVPVSSTYPITLTYPTAGQMVSGLLLVQATITKTLDSAGSYLMVDGQEVGTRRVTSAPYIYQLDTSTLLPGTHILQVWAHDVNNDVLLSNPITVTVP